MRSLYKAILIILLIILTFTTVYFLLSLRENNNSNKIADKSQSKNIENAIKNYMKESNDWSMNFAEVDGKIVVDQVLLKLQTIITYNGKNYGPYLPGPYNGVPSASHYFPTWNKSTGGRYDGWKIVIYKKEKNVSVVPSENGNIVLLE